MRLKLSREERAAYYSLMVYLVNEIPDRIVKREYARIANTFKGWSPKTFLKPAWAKAALTVADQVLGMDPNAVKNPMVAHIATASNKIAIAVMKEKLE